MAIYFVASGGSNTAPYETWAKAATSLQTALTAASTVGDVVVIQHNAVPSGDAEAAANTTYTAGTQISLISASNDGGSAFTPTKMGTANWIGNSTTSRTLTVNSVSVYVYGITWRTTNSGNAAMGFSSGTGSYAVFDGVYFWQESTNAGSLIRIGANSVAVAAVCRDCIFRFGATGQNVKVAMLTELYGCSVSSAGASPTTLITGNDLARSTARFIADGCDFSHCTGNLLNNFSISLDAYFVRCQFGVGLNPHSPTTSYPNQGATVTVIDCASGDTHGLFGHYDGLGSMVSDTATFLTAGAAGQAWRISTTAACNAITPYRSPNISLYNASLSAVTPYLELLRNNGTAAAYTDAQVWAESVVKGNAGFTLGSIFEDRQALGPRMAGTAGAAQTTSAAAWTNPSPSSPSTFRIDTGAAVTPAEAGHISMRVVVAQPNVSDLYVDPQIRT